MVTENRYRWDFIGLSTDSKPTPATSDRVVDGSTFYCSDNSKLYVFCKDTWYEKTGGGTTYTAGNNITISDGVISATDTTYSNFTGTDGTDAGVAGLVPAPAATDANKFLKSDGTWATAGGGAGGSVTFYSSVPLNSAQYVGGVSLYSDQACTTAIQTSTFFQAIRSGKVVFLQYEGSGEFDSRQVYQIINAYITNVDTADAYDDVSPSATYYIGSGFKQIYTEDVDPTSTSGFAIA